MSEGDIRLERLVKNYGDVVAVDGIDLHIPPGEFFTMLGPSGCGKTTTLRMIAGFERPTAGAILLDGAEMSGTPPHKRRVNTVFQNYALFTHKTVAENVGFGLRYQKVSKDEAKRRVDAVMEMVQISELGERRTSELSGGQQQRVALARALVLEAPVLLLDEPLGALDARLRLDLQIELKRIQEQLEVTFIYVTHDQDEALTMSDRVAVMKGGRIEQCDVPQKLYEQPNTAFVANFLGSANLLSVEARAAGAGCDVILGNFTLKSESSPEQAGVGTAMIRPEYVKLEPHGSEGENRLPGMVEEVVYMGFHQDVRVRLASGDLIRADVPNDGDSPEYEQGNAVSVHLRAANLRVLDDYPDEESDRAAESDDIAASAAE
ncbi:MAG: ABC transporter ATP-binding protein [Solirubrobacteraceae bacterium]|jgi:spermidine/putrescine transport system ATP-binding protein|nr:ABC transporter ATP-binding protein [Solirubrobacteraceae bacterium]MDP4672991.1 ABC transporter ATP-binding protein [Solirubrobacteraceae bacterium]MDP4921416.1 ABC transporter ATP-binding protein [Solirubrobacteraceae bacterium]